MQVRNQVKNFTTEDTERYLGYYLCKGMKRYGSSNNLADDFGYSYFSGTILIDILPLIRGGCHDAAVTGGV